MEFTPVEDPMIPMRRARLSTEAQLLVPRPPRPPPLVFNVLIYDSGDPEKGQRTFWGNLYRSTEPSVLCSVQ
jgi:hypothetical protein